MHVKYCDGKLAIPGITFDNKLNNIYCKNAVIFNTNFNQHCR